MTVAWTDSGWEEGVQGIDFFLFQGRKRGGGNEREKKKGVKTVLPWCVVENNLTQRGLWLLPLVLERRPLNHWNVEPGTSVTMWFRVGALGQVTSARPSEGLQTGVRNVGGLSGLGNRTLIKIHQGLGELSWMAILCGYCLTLLPGKVMLFTLHWENSWKLCV